MQAEIIFKITEGRANPAKFRRHLIFGIDYKFLFVE